MDLPEALPPRLNAVRKALQSLDRKERDWLLANPQSLREVIGTRTTSLAPHERAVKALRKAKEPFPPHIFTETVRLSSGQRKEMQKLQQQLLAKLEPEQAALLKIRGERIDPFPGPDPEPKSNKEE